MKLELFLSVQGTVPCSNANPDPAVPRWLTL